MGALRTVGSSRKPSPVPGAIEDAATRAGRDPRSIRRVYNLMGTIGPATGERFIGPVSYWVKELARAAELGMDAFIFWPAGEDRIRQVETFAAEGRPQGAAAPLPSG